jgi:CBS domain-containing protein
MTVTAVLAAKGRDIVSIEPTADLSAAVSLLAARKIGALLVFGPGKRLSGILSERDIVRVLAERGVEALRQPVGQAMTRDVATCSEHEPVSSLMERMTEGKFRHMPVMTEGQVVGVVSIGDVVKNRLEAIERETEAMRDYIRSA